MFMLGACFEAGAVVTTGARSCGTWVKNAESDGWPSTVQNAWLVGFISGQAVMTNLDVLKNTSAESLYLWVTNYCKSNPLDFSDEAAYRLFIELKKKIRD